MADECRELDLSIIVVSYNTREYTLACLRSVERESEGMRCEVLVVDNASSDGSADAIAREFPHYRMFALDENLGFGRANNFAALEARGSHILLLNPDTEVLEDGLRAIYRFGSKASPEIVAGGRTFFADGSLNPGSCWGEPTLWSLLCMATGISKLFPKCRWLNPHALGAWQRDSVREVGVVAGCFLMLSKDLWDRLEGFDPMFFMYAEDVDLCLRARALGVRCMITPDARIVHHAGVSEQVRADKMVRLFRARAQLMRKHWSALRAEVGVHILDLWSLQRVVTFGLARFVQPRFRKSYDTWSQVLRERKAWSRSV